VETELIKKMAYDLGADLCGVASVEGFSAAPKGFNPRDIYSQTKSVLVFAKRVPRETLFAESCIPYTHVNTLVTQEVDRLAFTLSLHLEDRGIANVMVPSDDPYEHWDSAEHYGRAILSLRHAGYTAGLGRLGKNTLLINEKYGNMIQIGALLIAEALDQDEMAYYEVCPEACSICLQSCPTNALDGTTVKQKACRPLSVHKTEKGYVLKKCWECRKVCPNVLGLRDHHGRPE
jgi:epoxyqueuosine reductase QueG